MGNKATKNSNGKQPTRKTFSPIRDKYETLEQVQEDLKKGGLESSDLIIGIDFTKSNETQGKNTFGGKCLHSIEEKGENPYQEVIRIIGRTLEVFDDDKLIPVFGFGDADSKGNSVFALHEGDKYCEGFEQVLKKYNEKAPKIKLAEFYSFAPLIREAIKICQKQKSYHILIIISDGQVSLADDLKGAAYQETRKAIIEASSYPLSIVMVGVGDGPWKMMEEFDDELPERKFDNFQFVDFHKVTSYGDGTHKDADFAIAALTEIPEQYLLIKEMGMLGGAK